MRHWLCKTVILTILILSGVVQAQDGNDLALQNLKNKNSTVRCQAAEALGQNASTGDQVIEALRLALSDDDHDVRGAAARALYQLGPEALKKADLLEHTGYDPIESSEAVAIFEKAWTLVNAEYPMFVIREHLDWDALRNQYRAEAKKAQSSQELAIIMAQLLRHLRDGHVWVEHKDKKLPVFKVFAELNVNKNTKIYEAESLLGQMQSAERRFMWAKTEENIGWIMFPRWNGADLPDLFDEVMEQMRDTRGLIVDVRWNGGGDAELSKYVAARFVDMTRIYSHYQYRNGPNRTNLTKKIEQAITPRGPWRYDRPVILLMGQGCISACESFCAMMAACPNVTTMGDHTRGSTGFPVPFKLGREIEIYVPQWLVTLPAGHVVDGHGVLPDIPFVPKVNSFTDDRDELMSLALARLHKEPLPVKPIAGPSFQAVREKETTERSYPPKVVSVTPSEGAGNVVPDTELRIRFDRPMHPSMLQLAWEQGGFSKCGQFRYDEGKYEFTIPIRLEAGSRQRIVMNPVDDSGAVKGFQSIHRTGAKSMTWTFSTQAAAPEPKFSGRDVDADLGKTRSVVEPFNETRNAMWAFVQTITTRQYSQHGPHGYQGLRAYTTQFTFNGTHAFCANMGETKGMPLFIFNEGHVNHISGYYQKTPETEEIVFCLDAEIRDRRIIMADPFKAQSPDVDTTIRQLGLQHRGQDFVDGKPCDMIRVHKNDGSVLPERQWWIDQQSHLLTQMVIHQNNGTKVVSRFAYDHINEALNFMAYMPDVPYQWVCAHKKLADPAEAGDRGRFIAIRDGTRGDVWGTWGNDVDKEKHIDGVGCQYSPIGTTDFSHSHPLKGTL